MNKLYYLMQCFAIVIVGTCALMLAVIMCGCTATHTATNVPTTEQATQVANDSDSLQLAICEQLLDECAKYGILDANGCKVYNQLRTVHSVNAYIELITECERETNFYDTIGSGDTWAAYVWQVLEPRGLAD